MFACLFDKFMCHILFAEAVRITILGNDKNCAAKNGNFMPFEGDLSVNQSRMQLNMAQ